MKKTTKGLISIILVFCILSGSIVTAFAASDEVYLADLRLIYADSYEEAKLIVLETKLEGYTVYNQNLNANTGRTGVWLAYKTTTNVDDAITDISIMQMNGRYSVGNYQEMIEKSRLEYLGMGKIYLEAVKYFTKAYNAGNFLATSAYRQLNFYTGLDDYGTKRLGEIMVSGKLTDSDLATFFLQGNTHVLDNVRSLLAMGVSYNADGMHYLERVGKIVSEMGEGDGYEPFEEVEVEITLTDEDELELYSKLIAPTIPVFRGMFEELAAYEAELNYEDEEFTDLEIKYAEYKAMAEMMRAVTYLGGKTLYDFCMEYVPDTSDYSAIYPLAAALNDGQAAMTKTTHYYDVVRYSMTEFPEETINAELEAGEKLYKEVAFNVYTGVDRDMFKGNFALTSAASRADAYTDSKTLMDTLFGSGNWKATGLQIAVGAVGVGLCTWAIIRTAKGGFGASKEFVEKLTEKATKKATEYTRKVVDEALAKNSLTVEMMENFYKGLENVTFGDGVLSPDIVWNISDNYGKLALLNYWMVDNNSMELAEKGVEQSLKLSPDALKIKEVYANVKVLHDEARASGLEATKKSVENAVLKARLFTGALYILGAASLGYSAYSLYKKIYDYYHPKYDVIPTALVDLVRTSEGDRYIKYNVVTEAQPKENGTYAAADLNAFAGQRWNALYYTKSYEAGKPLLAKIVLSNNNNQADEGYLPVHRFGEGVCYDLNKYNFSSSSDNIFLSIKQSDKQKSAIADVPDVIGSIFGTGLILISTIAGAGIGIGAAFGIQEMKKKNKEESNIEEE